MHRSQYVIACTSLLAALFANSAAVLAQQTPPATAVPPTWAQGRTAEQANSTLVPHPPGLIALAAENIPTAKLKAPPGFKVEL